MQAPVSDNFDRRSRLERLYNAFGPPPPGVRQIAADTLREKDEHFRELVRWWGSLPSLQDKLRDHREKARELNPNIPDLAETLTRLELEDAVRVELYFYDWLEECRHTQPDFAENAKREYPEESQYWAERAYASDLYSNKQNTLRANRQLLAEAPLRAVVETQRTLGALRSLDISLAVLHCASFTGIGGIVGSIVVGVAIVASLMHSNPFIAAAWTIGGGLVGAIGGLFLCESRKSAVLSYVSQYEAETSEARRKAVDEAAESCFPRRFDF